MIHTLGANGSHNFGASPESGICNAALNIIEFVIQ
jgi:hypothetical protein